MGAVKVFGTKGAVSTCGTSVAQPARASATSGIAMRRTGNALLITQRAYGIGAGNPHRMR